MPAEPTAVDLELVRALAEADADEWRTDHDLRVVEERVEAALRRAVPDVGEDAGSLLDQAERLVDVAPYPPVEAPRRSVATAKKAVRRVTIGPFHHLATQVSSLGATLVAALRIVDRRVGRLEGAQAPTDALPPAPALSEAEIRACVNLLDGVHGTVVHVDAGSGDLVAALTAAGADALGLEPRLALVAEARTHGRPVLEGGVAALRAGGRARAGFEAVVLSGVVDLASPGQQLEVAASAASSLAPGGLLVVLTHDQTSWAEAQPVLADLAPGRPLRPATWRHLLGELGLEVGPTCSTTSPEAGTAHLVVARRPPAVSRANAPC